MKTPRDILFARHQAAAPKLDAIRRKTLAGLNHQDTKAQSWAANFVSWCLGGSNKLWLELVWPCRRIWTGLAAVWILLFIVNFSQRDTVSSVTGKSARSGEVIMSLQAQQRWMNELLADRSVSPEADRPRNFTPKPRTEITETATV
jgi:hypothetical protein